MWTFGVLRYRCLVKNFNEEKGASLLSVLCSSVAHAAGLYSVKNLQVVGECTGPAVRGGWDIVPMAQ